MYIKMQSIVSKCWNAVAAATSALGNAMPKETKIIAVLLFIRVKIVCLKYRDRATHTQPISVKNYVLYVIRYVIRAWNEHRKRSKFSFSFFKWEAKSFQMPFKFGITITSHNLDFLIDILNFKCLHFWYIQRCTYACLYYADP